MAMGRAVGFSIMWLVGIAAWLLIAAFIGLPEILSFAGGRYQYDLQERDEQAPIGRFRDAVSAPSRFARPSETATSSFTRVPFYLAKAFDGTVESGAATRVEFPDKTALYIGNLVAPAERDVVARRFLDTRAERRASELSRIGAFAAFATMPPAIVLLAWWLVAGRTRSA